MEKTRSEIPKAAEPNGWDYGVLPRFLVMANLALPELSAELSMKVGGAWKLAEVSPEHFRQLAKETGLGWPPVRERLTNLSERIVESADIPQSLEPIASETWARLAELVRDRSERMLRLLK